MPRTIPYRPLSRQPNRTAATRFPAACLLLFAAAAATAAVGEGPVSALRAPLISRNLSPLYANLGVPVMEAAPVPAPGSWELGWSMHWASHALRASSAGPTLELDGESWRHDLRLRTGLGRGIGISVNLPYVIHGGGRLDALIDQWHAFWGMPDGPRAVQPRDRLRLVYDAAPGFTLEENAKGVGDVEVTLDARLWQGSGVDLSGFLHYKFDSGDARKLTGSGDSGAAVGARMSVARCFADALSCHLQLGIAAPGDTPWSAGSDSNLPFFGFSAAWQFNPRLALIAQLDSHAVYYRRAPLDAAGAPLWGTLGLRWAPKGAQGKWRLQAQFSEDLAVESAPDITFALSATRGF